MNNTSYVYIIYRPDGRPCYVGQGCGGRWKKHISRSHNPHLENISKNAKGMLPIVVACDNLTRDQALKLEITLIKEIGREINGGPLVNLTDGGDGGLGAIWSAEQRTKRGDLTRLMWADPIHREAQIAERRLRRHSEVTKEKMAAYWASLDETARKRRLAGARVSRPHTPASLEKLRNRKISDETRAKMRAGQAARWSRPEEREKMAAAKSKPHGPHSVRHKAAIAEGHLLGKMARGEL